ncbi:hypothetical protein KIN20_030551 [Parelaphostrongylus tenuis]|uniref:Signal recognition particle receptor alpha subunit N-terminal domain-containing protein n=1 Tax=Parelaphostrongylus tenuis TaxID=148309 RepID=A0AAD5R4Z5_PARTN|nr:hypothetical protein KIN20_030551 [Parelaphostrongylus tenuis]
MEFKFNEMTIRFKLDNEFELVLVVIYQSALQLSYTDKLLSDVHRKFRDMYKNVLLNKQVFFSHIYAFSFAYYKCFASSLMNIMSFSRGLMWHLGDISASSNPST